MDDKQLSEIESLKLIQQMIDRAKNSVIDKGTWPIYWGSLIAFCSLFTFGEIMLEKWIPFDMFLLTIPALLLQLFLIYNERKKKKAAGISISRNINAITYVWIAFIVAMFILSFVPGHVTNGITYLVLYGIPTFVTGGVVKFKPMIIGGIICWVCAIISSFFSPQYYLLFTAFCAIAAWLIPGLIMRKNYLRIKNAENV